MSQSDPQKLLAEHRHFSTTLSRRRAGQRGIAIVTVLAVLLLMTVLILAFFNMARSELKDARLYSESVRTRQLSEVVTDVVIAQIRTATRSQRSNALLRYTWSSQPGAITVFHNDSSGGSGFENMAFQKFKLYSNRKMVAGSNDRLPEDVPIDWDERPAQFVDLNAPVYNATRDRLYFPIVDPRGYASPTPGSPNNIEGFSYSRTNSRNRSIPGVVEPGSGSEFQQRVPMPVEWFYMLQDGTLGTLDDSGNFVSPLNGSRPTKINPMVARVAFWTDDESSKINVNVASEGAFWDVPRVDATSDRNYAKFQPTRNEVYRYPGHVSGISLSTVLYPGVGGSQNSERPFLTANQYQRILDITPKVKFFENGSGIGDREATPEAGGFNAATVFVPDDDRLYATVDEMLYAANNNRGGGGSTIDESGTKRQLNTIFQNENTRRNFERARHSLTAHSNAPEITLLGTPRICLWPMIDKISRGGQQTYYDRLIDFAATLGPRRYYWQKNTPTSRHGEIYNNARSENMQMLDEYLMPLAEARIPGYGGSLNRKYGGGRFGDAREIMIQIWDYMRNTNLHDPLLNPSLHYTREGNEPNSGGDRTLRTSHGQIAGSCLCGGTGPHQQVWWQAWNKFGKGHGRIYTVSEVCMVFFCRAHNPGSGESGWGNGWDALDAGNKLIEAGLLLETFCPGHGFTALIPDSRLRVAGSVGNNGAVNDVLPPYRINDIEMPRFSNNWVDGRWDNQDQYRGKRMWAGHGGPRLFSANLASIPSSGPTVDNANIRTLVWETDIRRVGASNQITNPDRAIIVPETAQSMQFLGDNQPLHIVLYDTNSPSGANVNNLIQVFHVVFDNPEAPGTPLTMPVPNLDPNDASTSRWPDRIRKAGVNPEVLIREGDVTRSMVVSHGDFRLVSGKRVVERHVWSPHPKFSEAQTHHAHSLVGADGTKFTGFSAPRGYVEDANYPIDQMPDFPIDPNNARPRPRAIDGDDFFPTNNTRARTYARKFSRDGKSAADPSVTGDFDNGLGPHIDGPYINRPDDGNRAGLLGSRAPAGVPYYDNLDRLDEVHKTFFSPNRVVTSSGQLGSLATGIQSDIPWRTLLFRPDPEHFGSRAVPSEADIPDHVVMDMFWMPIVEPFPISQPFSTIGKVNMNYQMVPFDYIKRQTAMHAVMKDQRMLAIPNQAADQYKTQGGGSYRYPIDVPVTLEQFEHRFENGEVFRSASEICEIYMVPRGAGGPDTMGTPVAPSHGGSTRDYPRMRQFWEEHALTGDNSKERTYTNLYPRLTTKSNVYQVHMVVEAIQKVRSVAHTRFDPDRDQVSGRWRGSAVIERSIDPKDPRLPDYYGDARFAQPSMEQFYTYRVLHIKQFNP